MCDSGSNYDYYDDSNYADPDYSYTYNNDSDTEVYNTAQDVKALLYEQDLANSYTSYGYSQNELKKAADRFAKNYLKKDDIEDVTQYLYDHYGEFSTDTSSTYDEQMTQILAFYGFMSADNAEGRYSPYTDKPITNLLDYLKYINRYYKENGLTPQKIEL